MVKINMIKNFKTKLKHRLNVIIDRQIENYINSHPDKIAHSVESVRPYLNSAEFRFKRMNKMILDLYPELLIIDEKTQGRVDTLLKENDIDKKVSLEISKEDLMFQYNLLSERGHFSNAVLEYMRDGVESFKFIEKVLEDYDKSFSNLNSFFDFAAGFGKLERILINYIDSKKIWVSDIKETANEFNKKHFKVNTIKSTFEPKEFKPGREFEMIFVGSLFSHLKEDLFEDWLKVLFGLLEKEGVLVLSLHDMSLIVDQLEDKSVDMIFYPNSEDIVLDQTTDSIEDGEMYGTSYLTEDKFSSIVEKVLGKVEFRRYEKALWGTQDVYVLKRSK